MKKNENIFFILFFFFLGGGGGGLLNFKYFLGGMCDIFGGLNSRCWVQAYPLCGKMWSASILLA